MANLVLYIYIYPCNNYPIFSDGGYFFRALEAEREDFSKWKPRDPASRLKKRSQVFLVSS